MTANNRAVGAKRSPLFDEGRTHLVHFADFRPGIIDIGKNHGRAAKNAIFQRYAFINADIILNFASGADDGVWTDNNVLSDIAVGADDGTGQNM